MLTSHCIALQPCIAGHRHPTGIRRTLTRCAAPNWNPQNVDQPKVCDTVLPSMWCVGTPLSAAQVLPSPELGGPEDAVRVQLDALMDNDQPWYADSGST